MTRSLAVIAVLLVALSGKSYGQATALPSIVSACLAKHPEVDLNQAQQPPYLKVRFSSSGRQDYLVAVVYREKHADRALLCRADGATSILGVPGAQPFSQMYDDDYMTSEWRRCTRSELQRMAKYYVHMPTPDNEAVCLTWEDGDDLIYERGGRILWKSLRDLDQP